MMKNKITMLGTNSALVTKCFNTCFVLTSSSGKHLLVDTGGGNGILSQLERAGIDRGAISDLYITHAHTDHVLGAIWLIRLTLQRKTPAVLRIFSHRRVLDVLTSFCRMLLPQKLIDKMPDRIELKELQDGDCFEVGDMRLQCFDIHSTKERQFGFTAELPGGIRLTCLGDEPYNAINAHYAEGADWLMSEAFCLYADRERYKPYEKNHSTALDAAREAERLQVRNLILYHTEEDTLAQRRARYTEEAATVFSGAIHVPDDLEIIELG